MRLDPPDFLGLGLDSPGRGPGERWYYLTRCQHHLKLCLDDSTDFSLAEGFDMSSYQNPPSVPHIGKRTIGSLVMMVAVLGWHAEVAAQVPPSGNASSVPAFGDSQVPSTGGVGGMPAFGDEGSPGAGDSESPPEVEDTPQDPVVSESETRDPGFGSREWRAECRALGGMRLSGKWMWLSTSGSSSEELWLNTDGSYSLSRTSMVSSYAEDGCYAIANGRITFYKALSSAMASVPSTSTQTKVTLGSSSQSQFEPRTVSFVAGNDNSTLVINGDRYQSVR